MHDDTWPAEWLRGALSLCVLGIVARHGPEGTYGYAIARELAAAGFGKVKGGTLYPLLNRLEADGHVAASWIPGEGGPGRKSFAMTSAGREHLRARRAEWQAFTRRTTQLLDQADPADPADASDRLDRTDRTPREGQA